MTLEEAIIHAENVAEEIEHDAKEYNRLAKLETYPSRKECESAYKRCCKCAEEHRQLAEWLKELKYYREEANHRLEQIKTKINQEQYGLWMMKTMDKIRSNDGLYREIDKFKFEEVK